MRDTVYRSNASNEYDKTFTSIVERLCEKRNGDSIIPMPSKDGGGGYNLCYIMVVLNLLRLCNVETNFSLLFAAAAAKKDQNSVTQMLRSVFHAYHSYVMACYPSEMGQQTIENGYTDCVIRALAELKIVRYVHQLETLQFPSHISHFVEQYIVIDLHTEAVYKSVMLSTTTSDLMVRLGTGENTLHFSKFISESRDTKSTLLGGIVHVSSPVGDHFVGFTYNGNSLKWFDPSLEGKPFDTPYTKTNELSLKNYRHITVNGHSGYYTEI